MKRSLSFGWDFIPGFAPSYLKEMPKQALRVDLPHNAVNVPYHYFNEEDTQGIFTYRHAFSYKHSGKQVLLHFSGVMLQFDCYLNEENLGHYISGYLPVEIDVTDKLQEGENVLLLVVSTKEDPHIPPFGGVVDYLTFGGIYREVYLEETPKVGSLSKLWAKTDGHGRIELETGLASSILIHNEVYAGESLVCSFDGKKGYLVRPHLWSPSDPYLYRLVSKTEQDEVSTPLAFRDAAFTPEGFFLNGEKLKLRGLNRHQTYPYIGAAAPSSLQREDARLLKKMGLNVVRTSHYADNEAFLDECDKIGLMVLDEIPGWQYVPKQDEAWRSTCCDFAKRLVLKERIHPSVIAYGLRIDESPDDHELYSKIEEIQKKYDPTRPSIGVRNFKDSECLEDVYGYNDFSCSSLKHGLDKTETWKGAEGKAKLVTEHNGHMFPTKSFDPMTRRIEHALRHAKVLDDAYAQEDLCGAIGWCAFDYNTHSDFGSLDHICYHGVADMFRESKPAAYLYASQGEEPMMYVASPLASSDFDECRLPAAYVFTNADYVELYRGQTFIKKFYPDKKKFPHLPHAPIVLDDWIGESFAEEGYSKRDRQLLCQGLNAYSTYGMEKMPLRIKVGMLCLVAKKHLNWNRLMGLFGKYIQAWGSIEDKSFVLKAYKDGREFDCQSFGPGKKTALVYSLDHNALVNGMTYDTVRIVVKEVDQNGHKVYLGDQCLSVRVEGPIRLSSPEATHLIGGSIAIFVSSTEGQGKAKVIIRGEKETLEIPLDVR